MLLFFLSFNTYEKITCPVTLFSAHIMENKLKQYRLNKIYGLESRRFVQRLPLSNGKCWTKKVLCLCCAHIQKHFSQNEKAHMYCTCSHTNNQVMAQQYAQNQRRRKQWGSGLGGGNSRRVVTSVTILKRKRLTEQEVETQIAEQSEPHRP